MEQKRLALGCKGRQGKDLVATLIEEYYKNKKVVKYSFAKPLYDAYNVILNENNITLIYEKISKICKLKTNELYKFIINYIPIIKSREKLVIKDRVFLQTLGDIGRNYNENHWANLLIDNIDKTADIVIITDMRYLNELMIVKKNNFITWEIIRPNINVNDGLPNHSSENGECSGLCDKIIINDSTIEQLKNKIIKTF